MTNSKVMQLVETNDEADQKPASLAGHHARLVWQLEIIQTGSQG